MECKNHPGVAATDRCAGCAEAFCPNCLVQVGGRSYCASCKTMAVSGAPPVPDEATIPCKEANDALLYSLIGLVCFGIILEPYAIWLSVKARRICAANPRFSGAGKATAALVIASVILTLWVLGLISTAIGAAQGVR